jgi:hypothetical protein
MKATVMWDLNFGAREYGTSTTTFNGIWQGDSPILDGYRSWCHPSTEEPCYPYLAQGTITWSWDAHWASDPPCDASTSGQLPAAYYIPSDQMIFLEPDGPDHFRYWGYGGWIGPGPQDCPAEVGSGGGPPIFFDLPYNEVPASAALPAGSQQTYCYELGWRIEETADHISGSCYGGYYRYDGSDGYNHNSLFYEWDLHKVGDPFARP